MSLPVSERRRRRQLFALIAVAGFVAARFILLWLTIARHDGATIFPLDRFVHFLPVNRDIVWSFDTEANLVTADVHNGDYDVVTNHDAFVTVPRKYQHRITLSVGISRLIRAC